MSERGNFLNRIKLMVKPKEKSEVKEEKKYDGYDIVVEDGSQIAEYRLNALTGGRACFGGYTHKKMDLQVQDILWVI